MEAAAQVVTTARIAARPKEELQREPAVVTDEVAPPEGESPTSHSPADLEQLGKSFESALNAIHGTVVQFGVSVVGDSDANADLRFRIIDRNTGEVVREFPPGKVFDLSQRLELDGVAKGIFIDDSA